MNDLEELLSPHLLYIESHPGCNVIDISEVYQIPYRSITCYLALLKEAGLIQFKGSKKDGGCSILPYQRKSTKGKQQKQIKRKNDLLFQNTDTIKIICIFAKT